MTTPKTELSYFSNYCPACKTGKIFRGIYSMNKRCPQCGNVFEKEPGYFIGAMLAAYFLGIFLVAPTLVFCLFSMEMEIPPVIAIAVAQLLIMQPLLFRYSRIVWIQIEYRLSHAVAQK